MMKLPGGIHTNFMPMLLLKCFGGPFSLSRIGTATTGGTRATINSVMIFCMLLPLFLVRPMPHGLAGLEVHDLQVLSCALVPEDPDSIVFDGVQVHRIGIAEMS